MEQLGDYESDDDVTCSSREARDEVAGSVVSKGKCKVDYDRLPVSRPLLGNVTPVVSSCIAYQELEPDLGLLEKSQAERQRVRLRQECPERKIQETCPEIEGCALSSETSDSEVDNAQGMLDPDQYSSVDATCQRSLGLPAPKNTHNGLEEEVQIDFDSAGKPKEKPRAMPGATSWLVQAAGVPDIVEAETLPKSILSHPMFSEKKARRGGASWQDLQRLRSQERFPHIHADAMKDATWHAGDLLSSTMMHHKGKRLPSEVSMYDAEQWQTTSHANPSKIQKRKHQINWLAHEAMEKEAELLDRSAASRLTKAQTVAKYGW